MPLRKSPTGTPALLTCNRRNAKKSTGPRAARGKAWSRLNRLRDGWQSAERHNFLLTLLLGSERGALGYPRYARKQSELAVNR
jgi:hypothetical protein